MHNHVIKIFYLFLIVAGWFTGSEGQLGANKDSLNKYPKKFLNNEVARLKDIKDLAKKLEYYVFSKHVGSFDASDFGLSPLNLNLLGDKAVAEDVAEGVAEEFDAVDKKIKTRTNVKENNTSSQDEISMMHQGIYRPWAELNSFIDAFIVNIKADLERREMDPLYFGIHDKGKVRHSTKLRNFHPSNITSTLSADSIQEFKAPIGVGILRGMKRLSRFGDAETRRDGVDTLIRSHYFFGPLKMELIFGQEGGQEPLVINSRLTSLAAHALLRNSTKTNETSLLEFKIDNPMEYEIRLKGEPSTRFQSLSKTTVMRLFRRGGRMETRLRRSFIRALARPIPSTQKTKRKRKQNTKSKKGEKLKPENIRRERPTPVI